MKQEIGKRITLIRNNLGMKKNEFAKFLRDNTSIFRNN